MSEGKPELPGGVESSKYSGRLELTWTNKDQRLISREDGSYEWVPPADYRVAEVRLLHDAGKVGDDSENVLLRGDALHGLTSLIELEPFSSRYLNQVKLAYLDPPFNTQQSFLQYDDALEHSVWLTMMRDRLAQVKRLLSPDGSVWVHCDDSEQAYLKAVMDEIFGRECFAGCIIWRSADTGNYDAKQFSGDHNYILVFSKSPGWRSNKVDRTEQQQSHYENPDNDPRGPWFDGNPVGSPNPRANLQYDLTSPQGHTIHHPPNGWRWSRSTLDRLLEEGSLRFNDKGTRLIYRTYLADQSGLPPSSLWADTGETGSNRKAKNELKKLFQLKAAEVFDTPKPEGLMQKVIEVATEPGELVLDCFLGSGTTAAVAQKLDRTWIGIEWSRETVETFGIPRLERVIDGSDKGGISSKVGWEGGGGFQVLDVGPSMFENDEGEVVLADWAINGKLAEATAAQLHFSFQLEPPFCGRKGNQRLTVIDGLISDDVVRILVNRLNETEQLTLCGTSVDPQAVELLKSLRPGSKIKKIPASLLADYQLSGRWHARRSQDSTEETPTVSTANSTK